jgi:predicted nucleic acid-binding protein
VILVDTSIWIDYFNLTNKKLYLELRQMLEEDFICISIVTKLELIAGASKKNHSKFSSALNILITYYPELEDWQLIESWVAEAKKDGFHFQLSDLLIASAAKRNDCKIFTLDSDFKRMERYNWIQLFLL